MSFSLHGLLRILHHSPEQLEEELRGRTTFADCPPFADRPPSTTTSTSGIVVLEGRTYHRLDAHPHSPTPTLPRLHDPAAPRAATHVMVLRPETLRPDLVPALVLA